MKRIGRVVGIVAIGAALCVALAACIGPIAVNQEPIAYFTADQGSVPLTVIFDGSRSNDPDGDIVSWQWNFGDGEVGIGVTPSHTYASEGPYNVRLTVRDNEGAFDSFARDVIVTGNIAPIAMFTSIFAFVQSESRVAFDGRHSRDPDGEIVYGKWDFGDGEIIEGDWIFTADGQAHSVMREEMHTYVWPYPYPWWNYFVPFTVTLTVWDNDGAQDSFTSTITVPFIP